MSSRPTAPLPLIVSSPSGAGKTTLTSRLRAAVSGLQFSVSHTTRSPRPGEVNGREYHFLARESFLKMIARGEFLEWAHVHGNLYGTSRAELVRAASTGARGLIFDVDHQGARQIKCFLPDVVTVFILPPDMATLRTRLRGRASEDEATVERRYSAALREIAHYGMFDYVLVNDDLAIATEQLVAIFRAEECRRQRAAVLAERLLTEGRGFGGARPPQEDGAG
ncbi:MAG: guanylate kinase [Polyangiaceae bacterium]|nr:guanylate kinase [Polyangiaceae bacterium]